MFFNASIAIANVSSSVRCIKASEVCLHMVHQESALANNSLCPSLRAYNDTCATDWCMTGALLPAVVIFEASALPNSGQRYLITPAELPSINVAAHVCVNCQFAVRFFVRLHRAGPASDRAHFPLHSVWRPSSEGGKRKTGRNKSEGGKDGAGSEETETETKAKPRRKKKGVKKRMRKPEEERGTARNRGKKAIKTKRKTIRETSPVRH